MSDKSSGDNKIHQIVMAVITTIAAPVIVFFITNNIKNSTTNPPVPTPIFQVVTATIPAASTAVSPAEATPTALQPTATGKVPTQPTPPGISSPSGTIPAGVPALADGLVLTVSKQDVTNDGHYTHVKVHVRNPGADQRTLVFAPGAISLKDDNGHVYEPVYGDKKSGCKKQDLITPRSLTINPQSEVVLTSVSADSAGGWCADKAGSAIPLFGGALARGAKKLEVRIEGVGPFKGFQVEIGL